MTGGSTAHHGVGVNMPCADAEANTSCDHIS
jgi:hypothetical protein